MSVKKIPLNILEIIRRKESVKDGWMKRHDEINRINQGTLKIKKKFK